MVPHLTTPGTSYISNLARTVKQKGSSDCLDKRGRGNGLTYLVGFRGENINKSSTKSYAPYHFTHDFDALQKKYACYFPFDDFFTGIKQCFTVWTITAESSNPPI